MIKSQIVLVCLLLAGCGNAPVSERIDFLGEKTGPVYQKLEQDWEPVLERSPAVQRAYLVTIAWDKVNLHNWVLCIASSDHSQDAKVMGELTDIFHRSFGAEQLLPFYFISPDSPDEIRARIVCRPFYVRTKTPNPSPEPTHPTSGSP